ncbi:Armadillo-type fold and DNA alkylation repair enzyme domain-containing protein [Rozella allomycis CSF55]|uniref:Armadillo-type fold and DNA alkylation repair enzyme domain-containing protein n=1 Tax=Rozella allomycis (strain CSF55) TaxID=988480 RepID=A0A075B5C8_ROZAC|nr:Armadillo-type fold and DNA alkylation repair enzyme domain-containing protein [Rozella allomycis CSF55]|eukprot:EPZ37079.1 Armadillo-type fold and DNA alkylation repair enzyme domain-containing protein [Rozella allomycis CSF55]
MSAYNVTFDILSKELQEISNPKRAQSSRRFFKVGENSYSSGDVFIGISVPDLRKYIVAKLPRMIDVSVLHSLFQSSVHEHRLAAILCLVELFQKPSRYYEQFWACTDDYTFRMKVISCYKQNIAQINNWDLVDTGCYKILGSALVLYHRKELDEFVLEMESKVTSKDTSLQRLKAVVFEDHDLINKAIGWVLREAGKANESMLIDFLERNWKIMAKISVSYAVEKLEPKPAFLKKL